MKPGDEVTVHQLLGRIAYFHTLFIEPALAPAGAPKPGTSCCNHQGTSEPRQPEAGTMPTDTAWAVLDEIATTLGEHLRPCPSSDRRCCATCRVAASSAAIAEAWTATEHRAYDRPPPDARLRQACRTAASARLARVYAEQYRMSCPVLAQAEEADIGPLPVSDELPLTGELLALWQDPLAATRSPVVSRLNHCTDLNDIHRVLQQRGTLK
ncbi:hypothetical protein GCM10010406_20560 [Streptomyces thermolineatus]|uniref:Uncharacterized protein n=1 Tax=Streptomyces thermolineatus TaxID=44033 RepID=A0ABN3LKW7_9ACTN